METLKVIARAAPKRSGTKANPIAYKYRYNADKRSGCYSHSYEQSKKPSSSWEPVCDQAEITDSSPVFINLDRYVPIMHSRATTYNNSAAEAFRELNDVLRILQLIEGGKPKDVYGVKLSVKEHMEPPANAVNLCDYFKEKLLNWINTDKDVLSLFAVSLDTDLWDTYGLEKASITCPAYFCKAVGHGLNNTTTIDLMRWMAQRPDNLE
jgi:hypothetical protein